MYQELLFCFEREKWLFATVLTDTKENGMGSSQIICYKVFFTKQTFFLHLHFLFHVKNDILPLIFQPYSHACELYVNSKTSITSNPVNASMWTGLGGRKMLCREKTNKYWVQFVAICVRDRSRKRNYQEWLSITYFIFSNIFPQVNCLVPGLKQTKESDAWTLAMLWRNEILCYWRKGKGK